MIATRLDRKLRDHILNSKDNLFTAQSRSSHATAGTPTSRPVLIILDRNVDLIPMLSHSWTYQSLCFDIFKVRMKVDEAATLEHLVLKLFLVRIESNHY